MDKLNRLLFLGPVISRLPKAHCQRTLPALPLSGDKLLIKWTIPSARADNSFLDNGGRTLLHKCKCSFEEQKSVRRLENSNEREWPGWMWRNGSEWSWAKVKESFSQKIFRFVQCNTTFLRLFSLRSIFNTLFRRFERVRTFQDYRLLIARIYHFILTLAITIENINFNILSHFK